MHLLYGRVNHKPTFGDSTSVLIWLLPAPINFCCFSSNKRDLLTSFYFSLLLGLLPSIIQITKLHEAIASCMQLYTGFWSNIFYCHLSLAKSYAHSQTISLRQILVYNTLFYIHLQSNARDK